MSQDERYMQRCLELASLGAGKVAPNPMVGAVVVYGNRIIGEGFTSPYGGPHAEVNAINSVTDRSLLAASTLYVSLEPCCHFGKTPPCTDLIIQHRIPRVKVGCLDPHVEVNGKGIRKLKDAGIEVEVGIMEAECSNANRRFFTFHQRKRPYIVLKWAETADGLVDRLRTSLNERPVTITSEASNILVHRWRSEEHAIMVGSNTAILDNPRLTTRNFRGRDPIRILVDGTGKVSGSARMLEQNGQTIVLNNARNEDHGAVRYAQVETHDMRQVLAKLFELNIQSVLVEGGPTLQNALFGQGHWDEIRQFVSPKRLEKGVRALKTDLQPEKAVTIGPDQLFIYRNQ